MSSDSSSQASEPSLLFKDLKLNGSILKALEDSGYTTATPIQARAIPLLLEGRDVLGMAQTGTGKTAAFALPTIQRIDVAKNHPQVLVLAPTRELALQVAEAYEKYAAGMPGFKVAAIYGGQDYQLQFRALDRGAHVVVGTPGRVMDHIRRGSLKLDGMRCLVLDEADEMLRMGFAEDVDWILTQAPAQRQIALFSATMPDPIRRIAQRHLRNPAEITIAQKAATADTVRQRFVVVSPHQKQAVLARLLEAEPVDGVLVFVRTKSTTEPLAEFLTSQGRRAAALSSDVPQKQRERIVENLRSGKIDVIIATDVAARGLDVQRISHVVNYDLPVDGERYVHRIGRTGRAGRDGNAIIFIHPRERFQLQRIERATRQLIEPMDIPSAAVVNQRRTARFHERITAAMESSQLEAYTALVEQYRSEHDVPVEKIAAALVAMAVADAPLFVTEHLQATRFSDSAGGARDDSRGRPSGRFENDRRPAPGMRPERGPSGPRRNTEPMETFRIEVGRAHQVRPANIVGAIANEIGIESSFIGRIEIFDEHSTVDLPVGMPDGMFHALKDVYVLGRRLDVSRVDGSAASAPAVSVAPSASVERRPPIKRFQARSMSERADRTPTKP